MTLIEQLKQIPDHRHRRGLRHPLWMLLILSLLGFLCGYTGYRPLEDFCIEHETSLRQLLGLSATQPMPLYSTFRRSFIEVDPQGWVEGFNAWSLLSKIQIRRDHPSLRHLTDGQKYSQALWDKGCQ
ncbi:ISAs1 family transposase, partial [Synechococcales cyanobacterium C]